MVAVLVVATFIIFVAVDYYLQRSRVKPLGVVARPQAEEDISPSTRIVSGFKLPGHLSYHPGHTWAARESRSLVRVGLDDFAARLLGPVDRMDLPGRGRWLRQGEKAWTVTRGKHRFEMLSPIEGEVVDVNQEVLADASLVSRDPYGAGWVVAVNAPGAEGNLKNLLHGRLAERWTEDSISLLQSHVANAPRVHLQDGGRAVPDILGQVPEERWGQLVQELFLA